LTRINTELNEIEETEREVASDHSTLENTMTKLRMTFSLSNLPEKLSLVQSDGLELKRQVS
jgi:hypothetical protein